MQIGSSLIVEFLKNEGVDLVELWCNVRIGPEGFYKKLAFVDMGLFERRPNVFVQRMVKSLCKS